MMKTRRPIAYGKTIRVTFSKRNDTTTDKRAITIVEATKQEVVDTIKDECKEKIVVGQSKQNEIVKVKVRIKKKKKDKRKKDEFSFRLYRCNVGIVDRLISHIDGMQGDLRNQILHLLDDCRKKALASGNWSVCAQDFYTDMEILMRKTI